MVQSTDRAPRAAAAVPSYTVQPGDSMSRIARDHGISTQALIAANPQVADPNLIYPGDRLCLPSTSGRGRRDGGTPVREGGQLDAPALADVDVPQRRCYAPGTPEQVRLFEVAAQVAGVPADWARSPGLQNILRRESGGRVGVPNYTYGKRARDPSQWGDIHDELRQGETTARSSATGLGQLLLVNVDRYYPSGRAGIGDPVEEAAGMLRYIQDRYGDPENAWSQYGVHHEGY